MAKVSPPYAADAIAHLKRVDPVLGAVIDRVGDYSINRRPDRFHSLVQAIIFQQLAGRAAQTIFDRFVAAVGGGRFPTPDRLLAASDETMRSAGLSRGKMAYIRDLATHVNNRTLSFHRHGRMTDDEIIDDLTRVRGIGRWTAEMFLMFNLHRPDVLPVDDSGRAQRRSTPLRDERATTPKGTACLRPTMESLSHGRVMVSVAKPQRRPSRRRCRPHRLQKRRRENHQS